MAVAFYAATFVARTLQVASFCWPMKLDTLCRTAFLLCKHEFGELEKEKGEIVS